MNTSERITLRCNEVRDLLLQKNASYGDSALHPSGIFSKGDPVVTIASRIDDKLNRIKNRPDAFNEDAVLDLIGYLVLYTLAVEDKRNEIEV